VLVAEDGSLLRVLAAPQAVLRITPCAAHGSAFDLVRAAYHLGNRHVPIELQPSHLQIEPDHVLAEMLRQMHLIVTPIEAAFEPESGAYGGHGGGHRHGAHGHDEHEHDHQPAPAAAPTTTTVSRGKPIGVAVIGAPTLHVHGPGCGHEH
jgi:urease accessory protein